MSVVYSTLENTSNDMTLFPSPISLHPRPHSITEHIDFATPLQEPAAEPLCNANLATSMHTLDHLAGVANRAAIHYTGESQLKEVAAAVIHSMLWLC